MRGKLACILAVATLSFANAAAAQSETFGDYTVYYSAFTTDTLDPAVARAYRIPRSKHRALLNITILKAQGETEEQSVRAKVEATASNLTGQLRALNLRELNEQGAIYYIADAPINNEEVLTYSIRITPEGESEPLRVSFQQQFFSE